ncbi:armadillo-type protein [Phlyctochytrium arcticum]|nr:armadillo-type protein [Phlyctochytrium arcticum]
MFEFAKSAISGALGSKGPSLPFTVGEAIRTESIWTIHEGIKKDDKSPVTVFVFDAARQRDKLPLARNFLKKCRTIRHPDMLKVIEGVELETKIVIGIEAATPLRQDTSLQSLNPNLIAWGLYKIATAIKFLNQDCNMIHGNIRPEAIYTTKSGEWRLGGYELLSSLTEEGPVLFNYGGYLPDSSKYTAPEIRRGSWAACRSGPIHAADSWAFGCLIHEVFNGFFSRPEDLGPRDKIPNELYPVFKSFISQDPKSRMTMLDFLEKGAWKQGYFDNDFISVTLSLEQIAIKDTFEKEQFIKKIDNSLDSFPLEFCKYKILPELIKAVEYGGAGAKALSPILKLGGKLNQQEFDQLVIPTVIKLFASSDRQIRLSLCEGLPNFANNLSAKVISDKIFPSLAMGFLDTSAVIREATLKSIMVVIAKLNERITNNDLLRYLAKMQQDPEPGIRTNTTICLGKITKYLNDATKKRVLVPAFLRSLGDPFPPARSAGLAALAATAETYEGVDCAQRIIPTIAPLLLDPEKSVRKQAFSNMDIFLKRVEKLAEKLGDTAATGPSGPGTSADAPGSEGWAGWAMSAVTAKVGGNKGFDPNLRASTTGPTPPPRPSSTPIVSASMAPLVPAPTANAWEASEDGWGWAAPSNNPSPAPATATLPATLHSQGLVPLAKSSSTASAPVSSFKPSAVSSMTLQPKMVTPDVGDWGDWGDSSFKLPGLSSGGYKPLANPPSQPSTAGSSSNKNGPGDNNWDAGWDDGWDLDPVPITRTGTQSDARRQVRH